VGGVCRHGDGGRLKKIRGLGESSVHWMVAQLAVESGIPPKDLLELEPRMLWTIQRYLIAKGQKANQRKR
jgi:hypothetical protein